MLTDTRVELAARRAESANVVLDERVLDANSLIVERP
jgi:hypothetical protein